MTIDIIYGHMVYVYVISLYDIEWVDDIIILYGPTWYTYMNLLYNYYSIIYTSNRIYELILYGIPFGQFENDKYHLIS